MDYVFQAYHKYCNNYNYRGTKTFILGGQGDQNLPLPVPCSPASRTFSPDSRPFTRCFCPTFNISLPLPTLSSPASRTPPPPILPGSRPLFTHLLAVQIPD